MDAPALNMSPSNRCTSLGKKMTGFVLLVMMYLLSSNLQMPSFSRVQSSDTVAAGAGISQPIGQHEKGTWNGDLGANFTPSYRLPESKWDVDALYAMCISSKLNFKVYVYSLDQQALVTPFLAGWGATFAEMMQYHNYHVENMYSWPAVLEELWRLEGVVTDDPEEADVFFIPTHAMALFMVGLARKKDTNKGVSDYMAAVVGAVSNLHPYWNRYAGARHVLMMPNDPGRCNFATHQIKELVWNTTILHCNGDKSADHSTCLGGASRDIIVPPRSVLGGFWKEDLSMHTSSSWDRLFGPDRTSKRTATFSGTSWQGGKDNRQYSNGARQYLSQHLVGVPGFEYRERFKRMDDYVESLSTSDFSLHIPGHALWSPRLFDSMAFGAIPVIVGEFFVLPYEQFIPYHDFIVQIGYSQLRFLPDILNTISPQRRLAMRMAMRPFVPFLLYSEQAHQAIFASICLKEKALPIYDLLHPPTESI